MPYLEFNEFFRKIHGTHVFAPHEMQWSLDQFMDRMIETRDEADNRVEKMMDTRYSEFNKLIRRIEETNEQEEVAKKTQSIKEKFSGLPSDANEENANETNDKNRIF